MLLDTTVLVYAVGTEHPLGGARPMVVVGSWVARDRWNDHGEVLQDFLHVRSRSRLRSDAASLTRDFVDAFEVVRTSPADLVAGADLYSRYQSSGAFDAVLAAVEDLPWIDLADPGLKASVAGGSA